MLSECLVELSYIRLFENKVILKSYVYTDNFWYNLYLTESFIFGSQQLCLLPCKRY